MSICPKNKSSKARRDKRRANWKMTAPTLVKCSKCGALMVPHRVCKNCGSYNKKEIAQSGLFFIVWNMSAAALANIFFRWYNCIVSSKPSSQRHMPKKQN